MGVKCNTCEDKGYPICEVCPCEVCKKVNCGECDYDFDSEIRQEWADKFKDPSSPYPDDEADR
jgi:hypothetical protein